MNIVGIVITFGYVILSTLTKTACKGLEIDPITFNLIYGIIPSIVFTIYVYLDYRKNPTKYNLKTNPFHLNKNPIKNSFNNWYSWIIGLTGILMTLLLLFGIKYLPLGLSIPLNLTWLFFALFMNKIMRNVPITSEKVISILIVISGVIFMNFHHFLKSNSQGYLSLTYMLFLIGLVLVSNLIRAYQTTLIKKLDDKLSANQLMMMNNTYLVFSILAYFIFVMRPFKLWDVKYPNLTNLYYTILIILFIAVGALFLKNKGIKELPENLFNLISSTTVIFAVIAGKIFFAEEITYNQIIGTFIILIGISYKNIIKILHNKYKYHSASSLVVI